jgi:hypothetical protein
MLGDYSLVKSTQTTPQIQLSGQQGRTGGHLLPPPRCKTKRLRHPDRVDGMEPRDPHSQPNSAHTILPRSGMHESAVFPPQKRRDSTAPALCHIVYTKMTNLLWSCIRARGGFIRGIPLSCKVAVGTGDTTLGKYHYWGTVSDAASRMHPLTFM